MRLGFVIALQFWGAIFCFSQKGGILYPVLSRDSAARAGYIITDNLDTLSRYVGKPDSRIFLTGSIVLTSRLEITADNVSIQGDRKCSIKSTLFFSEMRHFESISVKGRNCLIQGVNILGDDIDIRTADSLYYQTGIRVYNDSCRIINCKIDGWGWAGIYGYRIHGLRVEQCYISRTKNSQYGYGIYLEGLPGESCLIKDCVFDDCYASIDGGGQKTFWMIDGNVTDRPFTCHKNGFLTGCAGLTVTKNILYGCGMNFPAPSDSGYLIIKENYFTDSSISLKSENPKSTIIIGNNYFHFEPLQVSMKIDSVSRLYYFSLTGAFYYQVRWGDGAVYEGRNSKVSHSFSSGSFHIMYRGFNSSGIPSNWDTLRIITGNGCALKSSARFIPSGLYQVQILLNDTVKIKVDARSIWRWKRYLLPDGKISVRLVVLKDSRYSLHLWIDDLYYNGVQNSSFEQGKASWRQRFIGEAPGSGVTDIERCSGRSSWRFEYRITPERPLIKKGFSCELYSNEMPESQ